MAQTPFSSICCTPWNLHGLVPYNLLWICCCGFTVQLVVQEIHNKSKQLQFGLVCRRVVIPLCGGNIDTTVLGRCLERGLAADGRLCRFVATVSDRAGGIAELTKRIASIGVRSVCRL